MQEFLSRLPWEMMAYGLLSFMVAVLFSGISIPVIVKISRLKDFTCHENQRTSHSGRVPSLGGIAIFGGLTLGTSLFLPVDSLQDSRIVLASIILLFFLGQADDLIGVRWSTKLGFQLVSACLIIVFTGIRIQTLHGFAGIHTLPDWASIIISILFFLLIINAFNLIDGIDGLASGMGIMTAGILSIWLFLIGEYGMGIMAFALIGGLLPFFYFNVFGKKNKIFMGDTGSLLIGMMIALFLISVCKTEQPAESWRYMRATPAVAMAVVIYPLTDLFRVFAIRLYHKKSPFSADRNHIHHLLIDSGFSHRRSAFFIVGGNLMAIFTALALRQQSILLVGSGLMAGSFLLTWLLWIRATSWRKKKD